MLGLEVVFWSTAGFSHSSSCCGSDENRNRMTWAELVGLSQIGSEWVQQSGGILATHIRLDSENRLISYHCLQRILQLGFNSSCCKVPLAV